MTDFSKYQSVETDGNSDYYIDAPDILLVIPKAGMVDTPKTARVAVDYQTAYARKLKKNAAHWWSCPMYLRKMQKHGASTMK